MSTSSKIVYCHCAYAQVVPKAVKEQVLQQLLEAGVAFDAVADLCEMSAKRDPLLRQMVDAAGDGGATIVACYPRAVKWLFSAAEAALPQAGVTVLNMRIETAENIVAAVLGEGFGLRASNSSPLTQEAT